MNGGKNRRLPAALNIALLLRSLAQRRAIYSSSSAEAPLSECAQGPIGDTALEMRDGSRNQVEATASAPSTGIFRDGYSVPSCQNIQ